MKKLGKNGLIFCDMKITEKITKFITKMMFSGLFYFSNTVYTFLIQMCQTLLVIFKNLLCLKSLIFWHVGNKFWQKNICQKSFAEGTASTTKLADSKTSDNFKERKILFSLNKPSEWLKFNNDAEEEPENLWKKDCSSDKSPLSLHIAACEFEAAEYDQFDGKNNENLKNGFSGSIKNGKHLLTSPFIVQNQFEFPRQQNDKVLSPEVSEFRATQSLLNPKMAAAAASSNSSISTTKSESSTENEYKNLSDLSASTANDVLTETFEQLRNEVNGNLTLEIPATKTPSKTRSICCQNKDNDQTQQQQLCFSVTTNEDDCIYGEMDNEKENAVKFKLKMLNLIIEQKHLEHEIHVYGEAREENIEWRFLAQVRILTTINEHSLRVVDYDIFEFSNRTKPLILVNRDSRLSHIRIEIRFVHQFFEKLPDFAGETQSGDLLLQFNDGKPPLKVHSALMALYSPYMAKELVKFQTTEFLDSGKQAVLDMKECDRGDFVEVLYQIYSQARPLWADFRRVSRGAIAYQILPVVERITKHLVDFDMPIVPKMKEAIKLGIEDAIGELAYTAEQLNIWSYLIGTGFDPKSEFGDDIYHRLICPAILQAKKSAPFARYRSPYKVPYSLENPSEMEKPFVVPLKVSGKTFFVNKGILQLYNDTELAIGNNGERYFRITVELSKYLESKDLKIQDVIEAMLNYMNPQNHRIRIEFVRPIIMIANEHKMFKLLKEMEQFLIDEPPTTSEVLLDHLEFAQKYDLKNLIGQTLLRIEVNFLNVAYGIIDTEVYKKHINKDLQNKIMDRIVSGWGQSSWRLADCVPTKKLRRYIEADSGGPTSNIDAQLVTFNEINSSYAFGDPQYLPVKME